MSNVTDALGWDKTTWDLIQKAVHDETQRSKIGQQILPIYGPTGTCTVPSDITSKDGKGNGFTITEGSTISLTEISVKFALTNTQIQEEKTLSTAATLAAKAANLLSLVEDEIIFQGSAAFDKDLVEVATNGNRGNGGLLGDRGSRTTITVAPIGNGGKSAVCGSNT